MKRWKCISLVFLMCLLGAGSAIGQAYPSKPVRVVVAFPPGGTNDILARLIGQRWSEAWGQPVIVENRPGANTIIGAEIVVKAPPDGYTLLVGASSTYTVNPAIYRKLPYDPVRDLAPVTIFGSIPLVIAVHPSVPANSVRELIALAKSRPGQLNYGTPSVTFQVVIEMFAQMASVQFNRIPYKGSVPTLTGLIAGDVQFVFLDAPPIIPHLRSGKLKALAVTSHERFAAVPDLPTVGESGLPGYEVVFWTGLFAPAGTPREIIARLQQETVRVLQLPATRERLASLAIVPGGIPTAQFVEQLRVEAARYATVAKKLNIQTD